MKNAGSLAGVHTHKYVLNNKEMNIDKSLWVL